MSNDPASPIGKHHQTVRSASDADLQSTLKTLDATEAWDRPAGLRDAILLEMARRVAKDVRDARAARHCSACDSKLTMRGDGSKMCPSAFCANSGIVV